MSLSGLPRREAVVAAPVALHVHVAPPSEPAAGGGPATPAVPGPPGLLPGQTPGPGPGRRRGLGAEGAGENPYPRVLMGSVAHFRQAMLDADHFQKLNAYYEANGGMRPPFDPALKALWAARTKKIPVWWDSNTRDEIHRALDLATEFGTSAVIVGGREAPQVADRLKAGRVPVVLRLNFPEEPKVPTEEEYRKKSASDRDEPLRLLAHKKAKWKEQVGAAAALAKAGVSFAFSTDGIDRIDSFPTVVRQLITAGLTADLALAGLTQNAAIVAGVDRRLGTLERGKLGHVIVMTAPFNDEKAKVKYVFIDGLKFAVKAEDRTRLKSRAGGSDALASAGEPGERPRGGGRGGAGRGASSEDDENPKQTERKDSQELAAQKAKDEPPKKSGDDQNPGTAKTEPANVQSKKAPDPAAKGSESKTPDAGKTESQAKPKETPKTADSKPDAAKPSSAGADAAKPPAAPLVDVATEFDDDRKPALHTGGDVLIKGATILTVTKGTIAKGSILVEHGKIKAIGTGLTAPEGVKVIEANGLVAMPGIIDTHSHIAIQGGVNEGTLSVVPEVRVKDVVTGEDIAIYRALAGGTTTARLLHGSANTIGGQDAVVKLRYGKPGRDMIIRDGPQGVKFALGENVTRSRGRFPNTRMGVESVIEKAFDEARAYRTAWDRFKKSSPAKAAPPPRVDLRLEALAGILDGSIKIHSHCYRSDEILMLLARLRNTACACNRSSTCWRVTRWPPRSPPTAPARRHSPTGGLTRSRPTMPFPTMPRS